MSAESDAAGRAVRKLLGYDSGIRACAILAADGQPVASSADLPWRRYMEPIFAAVESEVEALAVEIAIATEGGELIAVRDADGRGRTAVALVDRHALGSLVSTDLRSALRQVGEELP